MKIIFRFLISLMLFYFSNSLLAMGDVSTSPNTNTYVLEEMPAADFTLEDLNTHKVALSAFKDKKSVLLFFWATWCPYCRVALLKLEKEYPSLKIQDIEILAIDIGESKSRINDFLKKSPISFPVLLDYDTEVGDAYNLFGVPTYILIDKKGIIKYRGNRLPKNYVELIK